MRLRALAAWCGAVVAAQAPAASRRAVTISDFRFTPPTLTVVVGDSIVWTNTDSFNHTTTADSGAWRSRELAKGDRHTWIARQRGRYPYHCSAHPTMLGVVLVR